VTPGADNDADAVGAVVAADLRARFVGVSADADAAPARALLDAAAAAVARGVREVRLVFWASGVARLNTAIRGDLRPGVRGGAGLAAVRAARGDVIFISVFAAGGERRSSGGLAMRQLATEGGDDDGDESDEKMMAMLMLMMLMLMMMMTTKTITIVVCMV